MAKKSKLLIGSIVGALLGLAGFAAYKVNRATKAINNLGVSLEISSLKNTGVSFRSLPIMLKMEMVINISNASNQSLSVDRIFGNMKMEGSQFAEFKINSAIVLKPNASTPQTVNIAADLITILTLAKSAVLDKVKKGNIVDLLSLFSKGDFTVGKKVDVTTTVVVAGAEIDASFTTLI